MASRTTYELRLTSDTPERLNTAYVTPEHLSVVPLAGTFTFTNSSTSISTSVDLTAELAADTWIINTAAPNQAYRILTITSTTITLSSPYLGVSGSGQTGARVFPSAQWDGTQYAYDGGTNLALRVWGNVGESGRDVLGNAYRQAVTTQRATDVLDPMKSGWLCAPQPSPDAVEALYFDIRTSTNGQFQMGVFDAIKIAAQTPGVRMDVYYTRQNLSGVAPRRRENWDLLLWTPASHRPYTLRRNETIELPHLTQATFVKLEFTKLSPLPLKLPDRPPLPARIYHRYPTWVEALFENTAARKTADDWFLRHATPVQINYLNTIADPVREFEYKERILLGALARGQITDRQTINSGLIDARDHALIDPVTASKIFVSTNNDYKDGIMLSVNGNDVLSQIVINGKNPRLITEPLERTSLASSTHEYPVVSSANSRVTESYQSLARTPMSFHTTCRHEYKLEQAFFNKKAYYVGIRSVALLRSDHTVTYDSPLIVEDLFDDTYLQYNSWQRDLSTAIPDPATVYVSYEVGDVRVADEPVFLAGDVETPLVTKGAAAVSLLVYANPHKQGLQYYQDSDYILSHQIEQGQIVTYIGRSPYSNRLVAPVQAVNYHDVAKVVMTAVIPTPPHDDAGTASMVGIPTTTFEAQNPPAYGDGTYGSGTYGNLKS